MGEEEMGNSSSTESALDPAVPSDGVRKRRVTDKYAHMKESMGKNKKQKHLDDDEVEWTDEEKRKFGELYKIRINEKDDSECFEQIAATLGTKTAEQCRFYANYEEIAEGSPSATESSKADQDDDSPSKGSTQATDTSDSEPEHIQSKKEKDNASGAPPSSEGMEPPGTVKSSSPEKTRLPSKQTQIDKPNDWMIGTPKVTPQDSTRSTTNMVPQSSATDRARATAEHTSSEHKATTTTVVAPPAHRLLSPPKMAPNRTIVMPGKSSPDSSPNSVAIQTLHGEWKKLPTSDLLDDKANLFQNKRARFVYERFANRIHKGSETRGQFGKWTDFEFLKIIDRFADEFADTGMRAALCRNGPDHRWIEFIDTNSQTSYVPRFEIGAPSGRSVKTAYCEVGFPYGVYVETIKRWGHIKRLRGPPPKALADLLRRKNAQKQYDALVKACSTYCADTMDEWKFKRVGQVVSGIRQSFEAVGVGIYLSRKDEYVSHGANGGYNETLCWIELVDRSQQPQYNVPPPES